MKDKLKKPKAITKITISVQIHLDLNKKIEIMAKNLGVSKSDIVRMLLEKGT